MSRSRHQRRGGSAAGETAPTERTPAPARMRRRLKSAAGLLAVGAASAAVTCVFFLARAPETKAVLDREPRPAARARAFTGDRGPWGRLEYTRIAVSVPDEFVRGVDEEVSGTWTFAGASPKQVVVELQAAGLSPDQLRVLERSRWEVHPDGVVAHPPAELVMGLEPRVRSRVYEILSRVPRNQAQRYPR